MFLTFKDACRSWTSCLSSVMSSLQVHGREETGSFTSPTGENQHLPINDFVAFSSTLKNTESFMYESLHKNNFILKAHK